MECGQGDGGVRDEGRLDGWVCVCVGGGGGVQRTGVGDGGSHLTSVMYEKMNDGNVNAKCQHRQIIIR